MIINMHLISLYKLDTQKTGTQRAENHSPQSAAVPQPAPVRVPLQEIAESTRLEAVASRLEAIAMSGRRFYDRSTPGC